MDTILTKTSRSGQQIVISRIPDTRSAHVTVDGKFAADGYPERLRQAKADVTHHIGGKIGLTAAEAAIVETALRQPSLADQRRRLVTRYAGLIEVREAAWERGLEHDGSRAAQQAADVDAQIRQAEEALVEFDAAHPEVLQALEAAKAERRASFERAD